MQKDIGVIRKRMEQFLDQYDDLRGQPEEIHQVIQDFLTVMEELNVADEELRQQNDELTTSRLVLEEERQRYHSLFEFAPDAYLVTDLKGIILNANRAAGELFGIRQYFLTRKPLVALVDPGQENELRNLLASITSVSDKEVQFKTRDGRVLSTYVRAALVFDHIKTPVGIRWVIRDISALKEAQEAVRKSEERFRSIYENALLGILLIRENGEIEETNPAFQKLLGYSAGDLAGRRFETLVHPDDLDTVRNYFVRLFKGDDNLGTLENRYLHKDGLELWGHSTASVIDRREDGKATAVVLLEDISKVKAVEAERAEMKKRFIDGIEVERLHLSREIHDGPMQQIYGAIYQLVDIGQASGDAELSGRLEHAQKMMEEVVTELRAICGELRPPSLTAFGLNKAIQSYTNGILAKNPNLKVKFYFAAGTGKMPETPAVTLFRVYQQGLANVLRHADASQMVVWLGVADGHYHLTMKDNGKGFAAPKNLMSMVRDGHYGLAGIAERVDTLGGEFRLTSEPGSGTTIEVAIPIE